MIAYLEGTIVLRGKDFVIVDVNGVGYKVFLSEKTLSTVPEDAQLAKLYTFLYWREQNAELYGFLSPEELYLFETLNNISGVGPRTALQLASFGSLQELKSALEGGQIAMKGVGRKKLQKIMLEITGKIKEIARSPARSAGEDEVLEALVALGIPRSRAASVLRQLPAEIRDFRERVKSALKIIGK